MYSIKAVAMRTGLTSHNIRMWERRHGVISPARSESNRRLYSEEDVKKLILFKKAIDAGHSIGLLAKMDIREVERLVQERALPDKRETPTGVDESIPELYVKSALNAAKGFDAAALESLLNRASVQFSQPVLIEQVIIPFLHQMGHKWLEGEYRVAHEHAATMVVRSFLGRLLSQAGNGASGMSLAAATPPGAMHEFGAILAALTAAAQGWHALYLGPNLPAQDIVFACRQSEARILVLSIIYPPSDEQVEQSLRQLRDMARPELPILVGGASADSYRAVLQEINATLCPDFQSFPEMLNKAIREPR